MKIVIDLYDVKIGRTQNHLLFKASIPTFNNDKEYEFDYIGSEVTSISEMSEKQCERLKKKLAKDFGYAPFDIKKARKILGTGKRYEIKM